MTLGLSNKSKESYEAIAAEKRKERDSHLIDKWIIPASQLPTDRDVLSFPKDSGLLTEKELAITESPAPVIFENIKAKTWTAYEVTEAFCHRSQIAHQLTNCLTEIFYDEALEQAKELDAYYEKTGKLKGRFHGVPISLKDNINVIGKATTIGYVAWCFDPQGGFSYDSAIAGILRSAGAVFYCKTNSPTAMMMAETINHVYGRTTNPFNRDLSSGGSSGGASAHAALGGSCIEIGSDIGGSIRIPSSFTGLYSFRPTFGRYPTYGTRSGLPGLESVNSTNGPMCRSIDSVEWYSENLLALDCSNVDPKVSYLPWKKVELPEKLVFGWLDDDGFVRPLPPVLRGMKMVREALEKAGHEIVDWDAQEAGHTRLSELISRFFLSDGGSHVLSVTRQTGEPLFPAMKAYEQAKDISVSELWDLHAKRTAYSRAFLDYWADTASRSKTGRPVDAILMPVTAHPASPHGKFGPCVGYTSFVNAVDLSAGTMPVTRASKDTDLADPSYVPRNDVDKLVQQSYEPQVSHGGPVSLQIVGRKHQEEKIVEIIRLIDSLLK